MSEPTDHEITDYAARLTEQIGDLCKGKPTASVYLAIGNMLGHMERFSKRRGPEDRKELFRIIGKAMDNFIENNPLRRTLQS